MVSIKRWQHPWIVLALLAFGLAIVGYWLSGVSVSAVYPALLGTGLLLIIARPKTFSYVMAALGIASLGIAVFLTFGETSLLVVGALVIVGIGGIAGGIRAQQITASDP